MKAVRTTSDEGDAAATERVDRDVREACSLAERGAVQEALELLGKATTSIADVHDDGQRRYLRAYLDFHKAEMFDDLGRHVEALTTYGTIAEDESPDRETRFESLRIEAALRVANRAAAVGAWPVALEAYDELLLEYAARREPAIGALMAYVSLSRGAALWELEDYLGALGAYDAVLNQLQAEHHDEDRVLEARALNGRALTLKALGDIDGAAAGFHDVIRRFSKDHDEDVVEEVRSSRASLELLERR